MSIPRLEVEDGQQMAPGPQCRMHGRHVVRPPFPRNGTVAGVLENPVEGAAQRTGCLRKEVALQNGNRRQAGTAFTRKGHCSRRNV